MVVFTMPKGIRYRAQNNKIHLYKNQESNCRSQKKTYPHVWLKSAKLASRMNKMIAYYSTRHQNKHMFEKRIGMDMESVCRPALYSFVAK